MKPFEYCVFIGRFQPFHLAHAAILEQALTHADNVIIVLGSAFKARDIKNPWTYKEREEMITACLTEEQKSRIIFTHVRDYLYNENMWIADIQNKVAEASNYSDNISIIGFEYDDSSKYLRSFPKYKLLACPTEYPFHAAEIRDAYLSIGPFKNYLPEGAAEFLETFKQSPDFLNLWNEKVSLDEYKKLWSTSPYPPIFVTTDCVVIKSGHVLVVRRKASPGKGLIALPGGFIKSDEELIDSAIRELKEETGIKLPKDLLYSSVVANREFAAPSRSLRGRTITHAYCIDLKNGPLPQVKGSDDAEKAFWMPLSDVSKRESEFFEDHCSIINHFCTQDFNH